MIFKIKKDGDKREIETPIGLLSFTVNSDEDLFSSSKKKTVEIEDVFTFLFSQRKTEDCLNIIISGENSEA